MDWCLGDVNAYKMKKKNPGKTLLEREVPMKAITSFVEDLDMTVSRLETEKSKAENRAD